MEAFLISPKSKSTNPAAESCKHDCCKEEFSFAPHGKRVFSCFLTKVWKEKQRETLGILHKSFVEAGSPDVIIKILINSCLDFPSLKWTVYLQEQNCELFRISSPLMCVGVGVDYSESKVCEYDSVWGSYFFLFPVEGNNRPQGAPLVIKGQKKGKKKEGVTK